MTPRVQIAHADETPASTTAVKRLHDLGRGVVVVYPTPGRGGEGIARDILQALSKHFRDRTPRDPRKLETLAGIWLRAERWVAELLIAAAERRPADDWRLLRRLYEETGTGLTMIVEQPASDRHVAALGGDVRELTLAELVAETPVMPEDPWGLFDRSGSPDDRPGYPPVPDVDFALFPSAFAVDHARHAGAPATSATARMLRSYPEPHLAAVGALACATRANPAQIAGLTLATVTPVDASLASGHRIAPPFQPLLEAQKLARHGADGDQPLFLAPDGTQPAAARHVKRWLARIGRETGLRFERPSGWNRYTTPAWATFHPLAIPALIAR